jgi:hypothetical protein
MRTQAEGFRQHRLARAMMSVTENAPPFGAGVSAGISQPESRVPSACAEGNVTCSYATPESAGVRR